MPRFRFAAVLLAAAAFAALTSATAAQYEGVDRDAWVAVVTGDDVYIRSGAANSYYAFGKLEQGAMVKVLEEKYNWARVAAVGPAFEEMFGYIKQSADEPAVLRLSADGKRGVTLGPINLVAPNAETGNAPQHSWKPILRLQPDRALIVRKTIETDDQIIYAVALPQDAAGWMSMAYLRKANPLELQKWEDQLRGETPDREKSDPKTTGPAAGQDQATPRETTEPARSPDVQNTPLPREEPARVPRSSTGAPAEPQPAPARGTSEQAPVTTPPTQTPSSEAATPSRSARPVYEDGTVGRQPDATDETPTGAPPTGDTAPDASSETAETAESTEAAPPDQAEGKPAAPLNPKQRLDALEGAFERLREEPIEIAEVGELHRLYTELIEDAQDLRQVKMFARARAEQLRIWSELQTKKRELKQLRSRLEVAGEDVQSVKHSLLTAGNYTAVGRIAASTVYDGTKLPRLYRVQDPGTGRTVAYLRPDKEMDLAGMLGQLVGIRGQKQYDGSLGLDIIEPERIDLLAPQQQQEQQTRAADQTAGS